VDQAVAAMDRKVEKELLELLILEAVAVEQGLLALLLGLAPLVDLG
jgi:hypothetical protein